MKQVAILQHVEYENPGSILDWIKAQNYQYNITRLYKNDPLPEIAKFDWLVIMGGPMGTKDENIYPWLKREKNLIQAAIQENKTVLGICLGSQLIAEALGAQVYNCKDKEIGWWDVELTEIGRSIFATNHLKVFQWHGDTFDLPNKSIRIASSDGCLNQGFIYNDKIVGLQFHLEIKQDIIDSLLIEGKSELIEGNFIQSAELIRENPENYENYYSNLKKILDFINNN